jgi:hypothetical protein
MGADRGAANLAKFNEDRSANVLPLLNHELQLCRKRKLQFKSVGLLASYLHDRTKIHRTTFLRNPRYKALLLAHLAGQPGVVASTPDTTQDPAMLHAKLAAARLEASGLREQLRDLTARLDRLTRSPTSAAVSSEGVDLANLSMLFVAVLSRLPDLLSVDFNKRELHDLSARPSERVIAGPERMGGFCTWVEQNQALPQLKQLKQHSSR